MNRPVVAGTLLSVLGIAGYVAGVLESYPGRSFSLTVLMAGITLALVGRTERGTVS